MPVEKNKYSKASVCHVCGQSSCGDDSHILTTYRTERNAGDRLKVILLCIYDLSDIDNLQKEEIRVLLNNLLDIHIIEYDELNPGDKK